MTGEARAAGPQTARVLLDGRPGSRHVDLSAPAGAVPAAEELLLGETWGFTVLPFPDDPEWHADMDRLELMVPEGGYPATLRSGSWTEQGLPYLSGTARYTQIFELPESLAGRRLRLDLGEVRIAARVYLDGRLIGDRAWRRIPTSSPACAPASTSWR